MRRAQREGPWSKLSAGYGDSRRRILIANSDGLLADDDPAVRTRLFVTCVASGDSGLQTGSHSIAYTLGYEVFDEHPVEEVAEQAVRQGPSPNCRRGRPHRVSCRWS